MLSMQGDFVPRIGRGREPKCRLEMTGQSAGTIVRLSTKNAANRRFNCQ